MSPQGRYSFLHTSIFILVCSIASELQCFAAWGFWLIAKWTIEPEWQSNSEYFWIYFACSLYVTRVYWIFLQGYLPILHRIWINLRQFRQLLSFYCWFFVTNIMKDIQLIYLGIILIHFIYHCRISFTFQYRTLKRRFQLNPKITLFYCSPVHMKADEWRV